MAASSQRAVAGQILSRLCDLRPVSSWQLDARFDMRALPITHPTAAADCQDSPKPILTIRYGIKSCALIFA